MKFTLTIDCGNAAFDPDPEYEIARILQDYAEKLGLGLVPFKLYDINGNKVGTAKLEKS